MVAGFDNRDELIETRDGIDPSGREKIGLEVSQNYGNAARRFISETSNSTMMPKNTGGKTTQLTAAQP